MKHKAPEIDPRQPGIYDCIIREARLWRERRKAERIGPAANITRPLRRYYQVEPRREGQYWMVVD
jgi:hypothetical protein